MVAEQKQEATSREMVRREPGSKKVGAGPPSFSPAPAPVVVSLDPDDEAVDLEIEGQLVEASISLEELSKLVGLQYDTERSAGNSANNAGGAVTPTPIPPPPSTFFWLFMVSPNHRLWLLFSLHAGPEIDRESGDLSDNGRAGAQAATKNNQKSLNAIPPQAGYGGSSARSAPDEGLRAVSGDNTGARRAAAGHGDGGASRSGQGGEDGTAFKLDASSLRATVPSKRRTGGKKSSRLLTACAII